MLCTQQDWLYGMRGRSFSATMSKSPRQNKFLLANRIIGLLRALRVEAGHHLREQQLANMLQVSRTPVRAALFLLEEHGMVQSHRNRGFFLRLQGNELDGAAIEIPASPQQDLHARIVDDRLARRLPERLSQTELSRRYGVEPMVVQKTLAALEGDGLITRNPGRSWTFKPTLDTRLAQDASYSFRHVIEPAGILMDSFRAHHDVLDRIRLQHVNLLARRPLREIPGRLLFELDADFHEAIAECSGNTFLLQAIQQQNRLRRLLEFGSYDNDRRVREWCHEHLAIIGALQEGDRNRAAQLMAEHLGNARRIAKRAKRTRSMAK